MQHCQCPCGHLYSCLHKHFIFILAMPPVCDCCPPQQLGCLVLYSCLHIQELLNFKRIEQDLMSPPSCSLSLPLAHCPSLLLTVPPSCSLSLPLAHCPSLLLTVPPSCLPPS